MKPSKLKKKIIIGLIITTILAIVIICLFLFTDVFRTKRSAFFRYFVSTDDALEMFKTSSFDAYNNLKKTTPYIRKAEVNIQSSSNVADSSIMDKLKMTMTSKANDKSEEANAEIEILSGQSKLASISFVRDKTNYAIYCPEVANGYIGIKNEKLKELLSAIGMGDSELIPNEIREIKIDKLLEVSKVEQTHIENYYNLLKNNSADTSYTKTSGSKLKSEGKTYSTTEYTLKLVGKESADMQTAIFEKLSTDSIMMDFITSKFKLLNMSEEYTDINTLNSRMQKAIKELKTNPEKATIIELTVNEYRQKNLKTTIKYGDNTIGIFHLKEGDTETTIFEYNNKSIKISKTNDQYDIKYSYEENDVSKSIDVTYKMAGTIEENNIQNIMTITAQSGIKSVTYGYNDQVNFTNDIGIIKGFDESKVAILNNYDSNQVNTFVKNLKQRINEVYVNKGAQIGINLDPLFIIK